MRCGAVRSFLQKVEVWKGLEGLEGLITRLPSSGLPRGRAPVHLARSTSRRHHRTYSSDVRWMAVYKRLVLLSDSANVTAEIEGV